MPTLRCDRPTHARNGKAMLPGAWSQDCVLGFCHELSEVEIRRVRKDPYTAKHYRFIIPPLRVSNFWISLTLRILPLNVRGCAISCTCHNECLRDDALKRRANAERDKFDEARAAHKKIVQLLKDVNAPIWYPDMEDNVTVELVQQRLFDVYEQQRIKDPDGDFVANLFELLRERRRLHAEASRSYVRFVDHIKSIKFDSTHTLLDDDVLGLVVDELPIKTLIALRRSCKTFSESLVIREALPHLRIRKSGDFPHRTYRGNNYISARDAVHLYVDFCRVKAQPTGTGVSIIKAPPANLNPLQKIKFDKHVAARKRVQGPPAVEGRRIQVIEYDRFFMEAPDLHISLVDEDGTEVDGIEPSPKLFREGLSFHYEVPKSKKNPNAVYVAANAKFKISALTSRIGKRVRLRIRAHAFLKDKNLVHLQTFSAPLTVVSEKREISRVIGSRTR